MKFVFLALRNIAIKSLKIYIQQPDKKTVKGQYVFECRQYIEKSHQKDFIFLSFKGF